MLFDENACLLGANCRPGTFERRHEYKEFIKPGVLYSEESIGTNAVSIAKFLKRAVYFYPEYHYCSLLKNWHQYCIPIQKGNITNAYLSVASIQYPISRALKGFIDLLGFNLQKDYHTENFDSTKPLTEKQLEILKMIAQGLSDEYIAQELKISLPTVKYHNQEIYKKLNAASRVEAVTKALIFNQLTIYDLFDVFTQ